MRRRSLLLGAGMLASGCARASAANGFAFVAPAEVADLPGQAKTAAGAAVLRSAARAADRAPHAIAQLHVEGTLPHQGIYDQSQEALRDLPAARDLALAGALSGEARFTAAAARLVGAWAATYVPSFNPIDETGFSHLFIAWDLLPEAARAPHRAAMDRLLHRFAEGYPAQFLKGGTATNNWNSHRVKLTAMAAFATGDPALIATARQRFGAQLHANIATDGLSVDFTQRDALHYVVYDLEPLMLTVLSARRHGQDWFADADGRIGRALAWLRPYAAGEIAHTEFVHSTVRFDRERRDAGVAGFDGPFDPRAARLLYAMAARVDRAWLPLARSLRTAVWQDAWLEILSPIG